MEFDKMLEFRESDFWSRGDEMQYFPEEGRTGDGYHLIYHCQSPAGFNSGGMPTESPNFEVSWHEPEIFTLKGTDYSHWMRYLRDFETEAELSLCQYVIESRHAPYPFTLGFFLVDSRRSELSRTRNRVCFLTDSQVPVVMDLLVGTQL
jgi:hypothetical protein